MINADERKQLLEQVTELERNSVNYFDVEKEFFLIDSDNLSQVRQKFYGYSIQRTGIYEDDNLTPEAIAGLDGRGCYVYVEVKNGQITIKQDLNGSWGIYLFRHGDYFALSNSFFRLVDHVKFKYPLTVNRDYCQHLMVMQLVSHAYLETAVNEIQLVERNAVIHIDIAKKNLQIELIDYKEQSIALDSAEGVATLDRWVDFWSGILRGVAQQTNFIRADLSGGFDSRVSFLLALHSGIDLNKGQIYTKPPVDAHTYKEDYEIASKISAHYGLKLNQPFAFNNVSRNSLSDAFNINFYSVQPTHKSQANLFYSNGKSVNKVYILSGYGGETIRGNWLRFNQSPQEFIDGNKGTIYYGSSRMPTVLFNSKKAILEGAFNGICDKYHIKDKNSINLVQYLYQETRCVYHFGKFMLRDYFRNNLVFSPALDPLVRLVRINNSECPDPRLLMTLLFVRYEPDLLSFPFDSKQMPIAPETIAYAKKLNERFPRRSNDVDTREKFNLQPRDIKTAQIIISGHKNSELSIATLTNLLRVIFESNKSAYLFAKYFDKEFYNYFLSKKNMDNLIGIVGIMNVLKAIEISNCHHSNYQDLKYYLAQDFATIHDDKQIPDNFKPYLTARVTLKLLTKEGDFQILSVSDDKAKVSQPSWQQTDGIGYLVFSSIGNLKIIAKASVDGKFRLTLGGIRVVNPEDKSKNVPYWIDYTALTVNDKTLLDTITPAWHSKPYIYNMEVKAGEEITINVEWQPHRSDT